MNRNNSNSNNRIMRPPLSSGYSISNNNNISYNASSNYNLSNKTAIGNLLLSQSTSNSGSNNNKSIPRDLSPGM